MKNERKLKIVYCTPSLYIAGGLERVLTLKVNYFVEKYGYDITIILTDGKGKPFAYPLSPKVKIINLDINFEELWDAPFFKKVWLYYKKQRQFKRRLTVELLQIRPDITDSLIRREINFITKIKDGSKKYGELHVNRANYRNFEANETNWFKELFAKFWMRSLVAKLKMLDRFVVLTEEDKSAWPELQNICVIPDPLSFSPTQYSLLTEKRIIAVGRYVYQKGFDLLLKAWAKIEKQYSDWELVIFGDGNRVPYEQLMSDLGIDTTRCHLNGPTTDIQKEYINSSIFVLSSRFEGFGMVLIEAMACGLPVVSYACPCGPKDIIKDGEDGLLVDNGNVNALAETMSCLITDDVLRQSMSQAGRRNVRRFNIEQIAQYWKTVFEKNENL